MKNVILCFLLFSLTIHVIGQEGTFKRHCFSLKASDLIISRMTFRSEYIVGDDAKLGLYIPISVELSGNAKANNNVRFLHEDFSRFYTGFGMMYYPLKPEVPIDFSMGIEIRLGKAYNIEKKDTYYYIHNDDENNPFAAFLVVASAKYDIFKSVFLGIDICTGIRTDTYEGVLYILYPGVNFGVFL